MILIVPVHDDGMTKEIYALLDFLYCTTQQPLKIPTKPFIKSEISNDDISMGRKSTTLFFQSQLSEKHYP